ncbi:MAG: ribbon-helix-helix domain-containing protein [Caulobacterales bacterium]
MSLSKRSMTIAGHRTSLALEPEFWNRLEHCARSEGMTMPALIGRIDVERASSHPDRPLASAARVYALHYAAEAA